MISYSKKAALLTIFFISTVAILSIYYFLNKWDGVKVVSLSAERHSITFHPTMNKTSVFIIYIHGDMKGKVEIKLNSWGTSLYLPYDMNKCHYYDWYGGDFLIEYIPRGPVSGSISINWKFR